MESDILVRVAIEEVKEHGTGESSRIENSFVESTHFLVPIGTEVRRLRQISPQNAEHGGEELHGYFHFLPTRCVLQVTQLHLSRGRPVGHLALFVLPRLFNVNPDKLTYGV